MKKLMMALLLVAIAGLAISCGNGGVPTSVSDSSSFTVQTAKPAPPTLQDAAAANAAVQRMLDGQPWDTDMTDDYDEAGRVSARTTDTAAPAGASGGPTVNDYYVVSKAFDGDYNTWWAGEVDARQWDLYYCMDAPHNLETMTMNFWSIDFVPRHIFVYTSTDGLNWTKAEHVLRKTYSADVALNTQASCVWLHMMGNPSSGFPILRDVAWTPFVGIPGAYAAPGANDEYYYPSNAFDGNAATQWAGDPAATEWNIYYHFAQPRALGKVTVNLFNVNYRPAAMTLAVSDDGETWTSVGAFDATWPQSIPVARQTSYIKITMSGAPVSGFPVVTDIDMALGSGAVAAPDESTVKWPAANAFDGNAGTWWVGRQQAGAWNLFYGLDTPAALGNVTVAYYAASHAPLATVLYTSTDGITWTQAGTSPAQATAVFAVNASAKYLWFALEGNPGVGYPLIKDISM